MQQTEIQFLISIFHRARAKSTKYFCFKVTDAIDIKVDLRIELLLFEKLTFGGW